MKEKSTSDSDVLTKDELQSLYWKNKLSQYQIGHLLGADRAKIRRLMEKWGIPRRSRRGATRIYFRNRVELAPSHPLFYILGVLKGDGWISHHFRTPLI